MDYAKLDLVHHVRVGGRLAVSSRVFVTDLDRPRFTADPGESPIAALPAIEPEHRFVPGQSGRMVGRDRHYRTSGLDTRFAFETETRRLASVQWGLRAERHRLDDRRRLGHEGQVLDPGDRGVMVRHDAYAAGAVSAFVEGTVRVGTVSISPGVRVERYSQSRHPLPSRDAGPSGGQRLEDVNTLVLPALSFLAAMTPETTLFANIGRGYTPAFARTAAGFPLELETGINSQAGIRTTALRGVSLEAAVFYSRITDTVVQLPYTVDAQGLFINSEDSRIYGMDGAARFDSARLTGRRLNLFASSVYTFTRATFTGARLAGNSVPEVPVHSGALTIGIEHARGWHASVTVESSAAFYSDPSNTIPFTLADEDGFVLDPGDTFDVREPIVLGRVAGRTLVSSRMSHTLPRTPVTLWVHGRNLADRLFVADIANGLRPGAARTVSAGIRLVF